MDLNKATTINGILKGVAVALATTQGAQNEFVYWAGLIYAVLTAIQGYLTNQQQSGQQ